MPPVAKAPRLTERQNPLSRNLDGGLSANAFIQTLKSCDSQIYTGFEDYSGLLDDMCVKRIDNVIGIAKDVLKDSGQVIFTGCGTSGRVAYLVAKRFSDLFDKGTRNERNVLRLVR